MANTLYFGFLVSCVLYSSIIASTNSLPKEDFDFLLLAQFWPMSSCIYFQQKGVKCDLPADVTGWTIHGLWPSTPSAEQPEFCNKSMKFDFSQIQSLQSQLELNWHYYNASGSRSELWQHEWEKHGTCAYPLSSLKGEMNYFSQTLHMHSTLNTFEALSQSGVEPSETKTYSRENFYDAAVKYYKYKPTIVCDYDKKTHKTYIDQIYLCYDKNFNPRDCTPDAHSKTYYDKCEEQDEIYYLPFNTEMLKRKSNSLFFKSEKKH